MNDCIYSKDVNLYYINTKFNFIVSKLSKSLIEKNLRLVISLNSKDELEELDDFLWTHEEDSFIPHRSYNDPNYLDEKIILVDNNFRKNNKLNNFDIIIFSPNVKVRKLEYFKRFFLFSYLTIDKDIKKQIKKLQRSRFNVKTLIERQSYKWEIVK